MHSQCREKHQHYTEGILIFQFTGQAAYLCQLAVCAVFLFGWKFYDLSAVEITRLCADLERVIHKDMEMLRYGQ